jgi:hypothetical protein
MGKDSGMGNSYPFIKTSMVTEKFLNGPDGRSWGDRKIWGKTLAFGL